MKVCILLFLLVCIAYPRWGNAKANTDPCLIDTPYGRHYDLSSLNLDGEDYIGKGPLNPRGISDTYHLQICQNTVASCGNQPASPVCQNDTNGKNHSCGLLAQQSVVAVNETVASTLGPATADAAQFMLVYTGGQIGRASVLVMCCDNTTTSGGAIEGNIVQPFGSRTYYIPFFTSLVCSYKTIIKENIRVDTVWNATGNPYYLANDIQVYPGVTLTIESAVIEGGGFSIKVGGEIAISSSTVTEVRFRWSEQTVTVEDSTFRSCGLEGNSLEATNSSFLSCGFEVSTLGTIGSSFLSCDFQGNTLEATNSSFLSPVFNTQTQVLNLCHVSGSAVWKYSDRTNESTLWNWKYSVDGFFVATNSTMRDLALGFRVNASASAFVSFTTVPSSTTLISTS